MAGAKEQGEAQAAPGPLAGVRVLDLSTVRGELTGRILADLGAEVLKLEPPAGAEARRLPPFEQGREGDPDASLYWAAVALGKRSIVLDPLEPSCRAEVLSLAAGADVLIESFEPGTLDGVGLGYEPLSALNPALIYVSISPFGQDGPAAHTPATSLTVEAAGGLLGLQGDGDRPPIPVGFPQAWFHAGVQAAADTVIALNERARSGLGQRLDTSAQAAIIWTLLNATGFPPLMGRDHPRTGEERTLPPVELVPGISLATLWACKDGYVRCMPGAGERGARTIQTVLGWSEAAGLLPEELRGVDWSRWSLDVQDGLLPLETARTMVAAFGAELLRHTKRELLQAAVTQDILLAPCYTTDDMLEDPQLQARDYWQERGGRTHPGLFVRLSRTPARLGAPAPRLAERGGPASVQWPPASRTEPRRPQPERRLAFEGLKVADFAWVGVGPLIGKALADNGATVIHVESSTRPDVLRGGPPYRDGVPGLDRTQYMANFNSSKLGLALNLATPGGRGLARRLVGWADVVIESFTPGTVARLGLDYAALSADRPELIMLSTCLRGQTGPQATLAGFGTQGAALAGIHAITGWPDRAPTGPWGAFTDFIAPRFGVAALAAAIYERRQSGLGQYIDLAQVEAAIHFVEPLVLDYTVNGRVAGPLGHDSPYAAPHGVYQTAGVERYIAIAVESVAQWRALRELAPLDAFGDPRFEALAERRAQREAIDAVLRDWARDADPGLLAGRLTAAGVPASVVKRPSELYADAQLEHRRFFVTLDHRVMGPTPYDGAQTLFSAIQGQPRRPAPCLGEHTEEVLRELLGLSEQEIVDHAAAGALT